MIIPRRQLCLGLLNLGLGGILRPGSAAPVRPFCKYSLTSGWSADDDGADYITHEAGPSDNSGVPQVVSRIKRKLSVTAKFNIYIAENEDNAFATVADGQKILVVDVGFLEKLNRLSGTEWGAIQVIAHEIGHHIAGFIADRHRSELNADYWSGQSLQRLGSDRRAATRAIMAVGTENDTPTHPNKHRRAAVIEQGWQDASEGQIDYSFCTACR
jgi:hypothetical protein